MIRTSALATSMSADCRHSSSRGSGSHRCPREVKVWKELGCTLVSWRFAFKVVKELERAYNTRTKNQDKQTVWREMIIDPSERRATSGQAGEQVISRKLGRRP